MKFSLEQHSILAGVNLLQLGKIMFISQQFVTEPTEASDDDYTVDQ